MKILKLILLLLLCSFFVQAQIKNSGFETTLDTATSLPNSWKIKNVEGFKACLDSNIRFSGRKSLNLKSNQKVTDDFISFSQIIDVDFKSLKRISVSAYVKTENVIGNVVIWYQVLDKDNNMTGFSNSLMQGLKLEGNNDWEKYNLDFIVNNKVRKLKIGGYLSGAGSAWFDDFSIKDLEMSGKPPSKIVADYIKEFSKIIADNSIFNDSLNWNSINAELDILAKGMNTTADAYLLSNYVISKLREAGDNHSVFFTRKQTEEQSTGNVDTRQPFSKLLENNIGYIYVPGFIHIANDTASTDIISYNFANKIQTLIRELDSKNAITGWIVDLRENSGGNMWPMIAGIGPLTGEGTLGHFVINKNREIKSWSYKNGASYEGDSVSLKINQPYTLKNPNTKIAVLIGPNTGSSGEMTAIAFMGAANAKLFGQKSAGYTTTNDVILLSDGSSIALSSGFASDRNNKIIRSSIAPDVTVEDDKIILATMKWFNGK